MDVREKLVELIVNASHECDDFYDLWDMRQAVDCIADLLIAHGVTVQELISVNDRLPKDGQIVLTYKNGVYDIQAYDERRNGWLCKGWFWSMATVTHWMPLPQPPKGE